MDVGAGFYAELPVFSGIRGLADPSVYRRLPDGWLLGLSDVVSSTSLIADGQYKLVNTAGAAVIAAMINALKRRDFPFVFGGDGSSFAVPSADEPTAREALAATAGWVRDELGMELRVALVPLGEIRRQGLEVSVARFAPSANVTYAMFTGGGLAWAERAMKAGRFLVPAGAQGCRPDLSGLSCRWQEMPASRGVILSLLLVPFGEEDPQSFRALVDDTLAFIEASAEAVSPVRETGPELGWPTLGLDIEARLTRPAGVSLNRHRAALFARRLVAYFVFRFGLRVGGFDPGTYRRELAENSDCRKYDDGLRMTLDCNPAFAAELEARLLGAEAAGLARVGLHRQSAAIMTCITPSLHDSEHLHFVDGAAGGYGAASARLKAPPEQYS